MKMSAMKIVKWLIIVYIFIVSIFLLEVPLSLDLFFFLEVPLSPALIFFFTPASCVFGIILFVYLCCTRQLVISRKIFFLLPHILLYLLIPHDYALFLQRIEDLTKWSNMGALLFEIVTWGLPFLLYCFLQVTDRVLSISAIILCFILPILYFGAAGYVFR
jgi:hypothetical protein